MKHKNGNYSLGKTTNHPPRAVIYARVSSKEQTLGNYPSCQSQLEELRKHCEREGYEIVEEITDEGFSAGSLKRQGLNRVRDMVQEGKVDLVLSTWYDRFTRSRDFYKVDEEFRSQNVRFKTIHDATDTSTATGRLQESMYVAFKTFEREQTSEKVRTKMRQRSEKGMWNGGKIPFGFISHGKDRIIVPDPEKCPVLNEMFRIYVESGSDTKVRHWLEANQIPARSGSTRWQVSTITKILTNRRYIAQIEVNRENKGITSLPEELQYRIAAAAYAPMVDVELFETAQAIREKNSYDSPNRVGRPRSFSQTQCNRLYSLQGLLYCQHCGHSMTPYYVHHKAGTEKNGKVRNVSTFINYYVCAKQIKGWRACDHRNCISAPKTENWAIKLISQLLSETGLLEQVVEKAKEKSQLELEPVFKSLRDNAEALRQISIQEEKLVELATTGSLTDDLLDILNGRATRIRGEKQTLLIEKVRLQSLVATSQVEVDVEQFRRAMSNFDVLISNAQPEEIQQIFKSLIHRIDWNPQGNGQEQKNHKVQIYSEWLQNDQFPTSKQKQGIGVLNCDMLRYRVGDSNP